MLILFYETNMLIHISFDERLINQLIMIFIEGFKNRTIPGTLKNRLSRFIHILGDDLSIIRTLNAEI